MSDNGRWVKLWCHALDDPHVMNYTDREFRLWITLLTYVKQHGTKGEVLLTPGALQIIALRAATIPENILREMSQIRYVTCHTRSDGNVTLKFAKWKKYQGDTYAAERQRRYRSRVTKKRREDLTPSLRNVSPPLESDPGSPPPDPHPGYQPRVYFGTKGPFTPPGPPEDAPDHGRDCRCDPCCYYFPGGRPLPTLAEYARIEKKKKTENLKPSHGEKAGELRGTTR